MINSKKSMPYIINFDIKGDCRGSLVALEQNKNIPFSIKRVYYIFSTDTKVRRGCHAHHNLKQILICVNGSCSILVDNAIEKQTFVLDNPTKGLFIGESIWREMYNFTSNCVLLVLASEYYDENDYIRDYTDFLKIYQVI